MRAAIPLADAATFQVSARRTRVLRAALALALVAVLAGAFLLAPGRVRRSAILPPGTSPIIVLDLSWSVSSGSFGEIARTLREVADSNRRVGLVVFSDVAYEELPPGTPSAELRPLLRFFQPPSRGGRHPSLPPSPWSDSLSGGTKIAAGLGLARDILRRDGIDHGSVVLISDLGDAPNNRV